MTMFGLMTVKAHEAAMRSADAKAYEAWSKAIDERNAANAEIEKRKSEYRSEEHTSELQSLMRTSYDVFCLQTKKTNQQITYKKEQNKQSTSQTTLWQ